MYKMIDGTQVRVPKLHLEVHNDVFQHLEEALLKVDPSIIQPDGFICTSVKFDHCIGFSTCVEIDSTDEIVMAKRIGRKNLTKFVKNRYPITTDEFSIILKRKPTYWQLITAYIGTLGKKEVGDSKLKSHEIDDAIEFWNKHALIYDNEIIEDN